MPDDYITAGQLRQEWGDWLSSLARWEWFVTLTLRDPGEAARAIPGLATWTRPGWATAKRAWRDFVGMAQPALGELGWARMFEIQRDRGVPHIHALVANTDPSVRRLDLVDWAYRRWGITRVLEYDAKLGASFYLCKYVTKDLADIELSGLTNVPHVVK